MLDFVFLPFVAAESLLAKRLVNGEKPSFTASTPPFTAFVKLFCATLVATNVSINEININIVRFIQLFLFYLSLRRKTSVRVVFAAISPWLFYI